MILFVLEFTTFLLAIGGSGIFLGSFSDGRSASGSIYKL